ncbi:MAG: hypothetical protein ABGZ23_15655, partial [Fuerstiella sp.]
GLTLRQIPIRSILIADLRALPACSGKQYPTISDRISCAEHYWVRYQKCEASFGPFRFWVPDPVFLDSKRNRASHQQD